MTRIVGGVARGQRLAVPDGARPTGDRAREALFSMLESLRGPWSGAHVLDLYSGSGALGLEALSRGASTVDLVESDKAAAATIGANIGGVVRPGVAGVAKVHQRAVERWLQQRPGSQTRSYDVVFLDPPYATSSAQVSSVVTELGSAGWLAADAVVVLERASRDPSWVWPEHFEVLRDRRYGEAHLWVAGWAGRAPDSSAGPFAGPKER